MNPAKETIDNDWPFNKVWTEEELKTLRENAVKEDGVIEYTCDTCGLKSKCDLVYDLYNTNGDCLADK